MSDDIFFNLREIIDWLVWGRIQFMKKSIALTVDMNILLTHIGYISKIFLSTDEKTD